MRLAQFISQNSERICEEWEKFAATRLPAARTMRRVERRDHIDAILRRIAEDLESPQTRQEQIEKAKGIADAHGGGESAATSHGTARAQSGYTPDQMVSEFRALRASVVRLWLDGTDRCDRQSFDDVTRFHEAIDQALAESVRSFAENVDHAKDLFLGVLGHDLRTPLAVMMIGATIMITEGGADWPHAKTASRILSSGTRMEDIIGDLLDFTRGRLGGGIPVARDEVDLDALLRQNIDELAAFHDRCPITFESAGSMIGRWDGARLGQVMANLIGNACEHGTRGEPITITLGGDRDTAIVTIHNKGAMIPPQHLADIFEPFRRLGSDTTNRSGSIGLGLYIAKAIVTSHEGTIDVASTDHGTTFTVQLPRRISAAK